MLRITPSYNKHPLPGLAKANPESFFGPNLAACINGTNYLICVDSAHFSISLIELRGQGMEDIYDLPSDWITDDLVLSRIYFTAGVAANARCGSLCTDASGTLIYLLLLEPPRSYIKVFHLTSDLKLVEYPEELFELPYDSTPVYPAYTSDPATGDAGFVDTVVLTDVIGEACWVNSHLSGTGLAYYAGKLLILMRRQMTICVPLPATLPVEKVERTEIVQVSTLFQVDVDTWRVEGACHLSLPGIGGVKSVFDAVFSGLALYGNTLYLGRRLDKQVLPHFSGLWGFQGVRVERGEAALCALTLPAPTTDWLGSFPSVPFRGSLVTEVTDSYPFALALPLTLSVEPSKRKLYAVFGNKALIFDMLPFTILINYGVEVGALFEGEIIDFGYIKDNALHTLTCYLRNDDNFPLTNIRLRIYLKKEEPRRANVALALNSTDPGVVDLVLGNLLPAQSASFEVRVRVMDIGINEEFATVRVPLKVSYDLI